MSEEMIKLTAAPSTVTLAGKDYRVSKLRPREFGELASWLAGQVPDPRALVRKHMEGLPENVQIAMWKDACLEAKSWPPAIDSDEGNALLMSPAGQLELVYLALRRHTAGFTRADAETVAEAISEEELGELLDLVTNGSKTAPKAPPAEVTPAAE
jgi:hypothetical protein